MMPGWFPLGVLPMAFVLAFGWLLTLSPNADDGRAHRLAKKADLGLPPYMDQRVRRWLRRESMLVMSGLVPIGAVMTVSCFDESRSNFSAAYPYLLLVVVACVIGYGSLVGLTLVPSKTEPSQIGPSQIGPSQIGPPQIGPPEIGPPEIGPVRLAHLRAPTVGQAFTPLELAVLFAGAAVAGAGAGWGLWRTSAGPLWCAACPPALVVGFGFSYLRAKAVLGAPSAAGDVLELGWDDLLRFRAVRCCCICAAWLPALLMLFVDTQLVGAWGPVQQRPLLGFCRLALVGVQGVLKLVFRRGDQRWRRLWELPRRPIMPWPPGPPAAEAPEG
jgi:hypothetical protein